MQRNAVLRAMQTRAHRFLGTSVFLAEKENSSCLSDALELNNMLMQLCLFAHKLWREHTTISLRNERPTSSERNAFELGWCGWKRSQLHGDGWLCTANGVDRKRWRDQRFDKERWPIETGNRRTSGGRLPEAAVAPTHPECRRRWTATRVPP